MFHGGSRRLRCKSRRGSIGLGVARSMAGMMSVIKAEKAICASIVQQIKRFSFSWLDSGISEACHTLLRSKFCRKELPLAVGTVEGSSEFRFVENASGLVEGPTLGRGSTLFFILDEVIHCFLSIRTLVPVNLTVVVLYKLPDSLTRTSS